MRNITQNLFFHAILILLVGSIAWYFYTDQSKKTKLSILNHFTDLIYYFVWALFGINVIFNLREIIAVPYRAIIFSSDAVAIATFIVTVYAGITYGDRFWARPTQAKSAVQLFLFIGLVNHIYLYFIYSNVRSIFFIGYFILLLGLTSSTRFMRTIDPSFVLLGAGFTHFLLMGAGVVLYLNFAFYPLPFLIIFMTSIVILFLQRRKRLSKRT